VHKKVVTTKVISLLGLLEVVGEGKSTCASKPAAFDILISHKNGG